MKFLACAALAALVSMPVHAVGATVYGRLILSDWAEAHPELDVCVRLMRRAFNMADPASFERAIDARHEMEMARDAYFDGDELSCKRHAIQAFEDRTQPG